MMRYECDRRGFLRRAVAGTAGALAGSSLMPGRVEAGSTRADVLVIGAGMAGVTAGRVLQDAKYNVIVLEGRPDRIGGRIWSSHAWSDAAVDLGASWLTHETINPLAAIARVHGITTVPSDLSNFELREAYGQVLSESTVANLSALYSANYAAVKVVGATRAARGLPDISASDAFNSFFAQERLEPTTRRRLNYFLDYAIRNPQCADLTDLSLNYWDNDYVFVQLFTSVFPQGYRQLIDILATNLDIRLGQVVREVDYGPGGVTVSTNQGNFYAPRAIVTLPHAVLNSGAITFSPTLPAWKRAAMKRLHTGLTDKLYIRFPRPFWSPDYDTLGRIPETTNAGWSTWLNFYKYTGIPMLMVFNHTDLAVQLEGMSDTEVTDTAMAVLRKAYGRSIPDPLGIQRSRWGADPFTRGTYAHVPPGSTDRDYALMGQSVGPLYFAGESTDPDFPTLVFGAYRSGVREALAIENS